MKKILFLLTISLFLLFIKTDAQSITNASYDSIEYKVRFTVIRAETSKEIELWPEVNFKKSSGEIDMVRTLPRIAKVGEKELFFTYAVPSGSSNIRIVLLTSNEKRTTFSQVDVKKIAK
jgi:hypothetical protein